MDERVTQAQWKNEPLVDPIQIPAPERIWTDDEMDRICLGLLPGSMDHKWFIYMEDNHLHMHRSWTGHGIYEATFIKTDGGHRITTAAILRPTLAERRTSWTPPRTRAR